MARFGGSAGHGAGNPGHIVEDYESDSGYGDEANEANEAAAAAEREREAEAEERRKARQQEMQACRQQIADRFATAVFKDDKATIHAILTDSDQLKIVQDLRTASGKSMFIFAVLKGHHAIVRDMIEAKFKVTQTHYPAGEHALHLAAAAGDVAMVKVLLAARSPCYPINLTNSLGQTALHVAAKAGKDEIVKLLCTYKACVSTRDKAGFLALNYAIDFANDNHRALDPSVKVQLEETSWMDAALSCI